jgi:hypothetical protein
MVKRRNESEFDKLACLIKEEGGDIRKEMATKEDIASVYRVMSTKEDIAEVQRDMATGGTWKMQKKKFWKFCVRIVRLIKTHSPLLIAESVSCALRRRLVFH